MFVAGAELSNNLILSILSGSVCLQNLLPDLIETIWPISVKLTGRTTLGTSSALLKSGPRPVVA